MSPYDAWKENAPELDEEPPQPCPVCTGSEDAEPCSEECAYLVDVVRAKRTVRHLYAACWRAMRLARKYREEERWRGRKDRRLRDVMGSIGVWRQDIALIRKHDIRRVAA